jgi:hypothetical protein
MRIDFPNLTRPKKSAKILSRVLERPLARCQSALAKVCGYRDWHELEQQVAPACDSILDQNLSTDEYVDRQVKMGLCIAELLDVDDDEAQFALVRANITGNRESSLAEQLAIRAGCLRRTALPDAGRGHRGSIGKVMSPGRNGEVVILKRLGRPTYVLTHRTPDAAVGDFEFVSPRHPLPLFIPMSLYVPYGVWTEKDGSRVLFSRDYKPLWRLTPAKRPARANPWDRIQFDREEWFWGDTDTPWASNARYEIELKRLQDLGVVGLPKLVETLPHLVMRDDLRSVEDAVELLRDKYEAVRLS